MTHRPVSDGDTVEPVALLDSVAGERVDQALQELIAAVDWRN
jgi:hypothetical protein